VTIRLVIWLAAALCASAGCSDVKRFAYEGVGRDEWQQPARVVETLALRPGDQVADLGAGGGYFTFRLAEAVGPTGRVYAVDVDPGMTQHLAGRARELGVANVEAVLAAEDDPRLPDGALNLVFTCNTYHHLADRTAYFARLQRDLAPEGRVAVIEHAGKGLISGLFGHHTSAETIRSEMEAAGYRLVDAPGFLEKQHFLIFSAKPD
jgi:ubiquinone/menaquinone biosynthesis C-methylase UbiE